MTTPPPIPTTPTMEELLAWLNTAWMYGPWMSDLDKRNYAAVTEVVRTATANERDAARYRYISSDALGLTLKSDLLVGAELDRELDKEMKAAQSGDAKEG